MQLTKLALAGLALMLLAMACGQSSRPNQPTYATVADAQADMDPIDQYIVVDFYTDW